MYTYICVCAYRMKLYWMKLYRMKLSIPFVALEQPVIISCKDFLIVHFAAQRKPQAAVRLNRNLVLLRAEGPIKKHDAKGSSIGARRREGPLVVVIRHKGRHKRLAWKPPPHPECCKSHVALC